MKDPMIMVENLKKVYRIKGGALSRTRPLRALDDVSFRVEAGQTFGLVGESGSGKTTIARILMGAEPATEGTIEIGGRALGRARPSELQWLRRILQPVLQDPYSSLSPRMRVRHIIDEPLRVHRPEMSEAALGESVATLLGKVSLPQSYADHLPHQLSGGQRQRVAIARALALNPQVMVLDEPASALDVSIQAQIINLLADIQAEQRLTYVIISHDLAVVAYLSHQIGVLYLGQFMEVGAKNAVIGKPRHPYTQAMIAASEPGDDLDVHILGGEIPSPLDPPPGCPFSPRCRFAEPRCKEIKPVLRQVTDQQWVACHLA